MNDCDPEDKALAFLNLELAGTRHRGADGAYNAAKILYTLIWAISILAQQVCINHPQNGFMIYHPFKVLVGRSYQVIMRTRI